MRANSLAFRLFLWATGLTVVVLIVTGIALVHALSQRCRARLRPAPRCLSAHAGCRHRFAGGRQREIPAIDRRAAVRVAAVGLVLAGHAARHAKPEVHSSRSLWDSNLPRLPETKDDPLRCAGIAKVTHGPRRSAAAPRRAQHRPRRRRALSDHGRRKRIRDRRRDAELRPHHRRDFSRVLLSALLVDHRRCRCALVLRR